MMGAVAASTLGRYRLVERIATGGMGEVWRGVDTGWGGIERPVAVKVIAPIFAREPDFVRTFVDEARLSFLLCHSNVVTVRDIGQTDETWFIAMEWVEGGDLGAILKRMDKRAGQPLPMRFAVLVAVEAARGLDYAHRLRDGSGQALNVVHRDISPSNLLVSFEGEVKVTDFGIARSRLKTTPSMPGAFKGKLGYLAPEQARGEDVDPRADLFALGAVLYEMLTGANPFTSNCTEREALGRVQTGSFQPPRLHNPAIPQGLEAIVLRAMAPDREKRYADCGAMREDLEALARREGYAMSPSDLGAFVRELLQMPLVDAKAPTDPALGQKKRITSPKPFDIALGESLAQLNAPDPVEESLPEGGVTAPGKRSTVAVGHPVIRVSEPRPVAPPPRSLSAETEQIPRTWSPKTAWVAVGLVLLVVAVSVGVSLAQRRGNHAEILPPVAASPPPRVEAAPPPPPLKSEVVRERIVAEARAPRKLVAAPARLSVDSDVAADIYIDGKFVRATPLLGLELAPGSYVVRAESSASGLRLIPREEIVVLKAGESRQLRMELK
jgi:serine/threonine protein kinase